MLWHVLFNAIAFVRFCGNDEQREIGFRVNDYIAEFSIFISNFLDHQRRLKALFENQRKTNEVLHQSLVQIVSKEEGNPVSIAPLPPFPDRVNTTGGDGVGSSAS